MSPKSKRGDGDRVIAASAGLDNWKTWAGRSSGPDTFEPLDLFRGMKRSFQKRYVWTTPPLGTLCPVCFTEPESSEEWHTTSSCGHSVCLDCLAGYAASQVDDDEHSGPLLCPCCPSALRQSDAIRALEHNPDVIRRWDAKIRDQLLRALPNFRNCPHCQKSSSSHSSQSSESNSNAAASRTQTQNASISHNGGGFVTPECLEPINKDREQDAEKILGLLTILDRLVIGGYFLYMTFYSSLQTTSIFVALLNAYFLPAFLIHRIKLICYALVARSARHALYKPITVECPCCDNEFILNAQAELSPDRNAAIADKATAEWIGSHTRPCPSCSVPISKSSGCNHMRCSHCRASFCWACMRLRTRCAAYSCRNGAPYGNAAVRRDAFGVVDDGEDINAGGIVERIERLERRATRLERRDLVAVGVLSVAIFWRDSAIIRGLSHVLVSIFSAIFCQGFFFTVVLVVVMFRPFIEQVMERLNEQQQRDQRQIHRQRERQARGFNRIQGNALLRRGQEMLEQQMLDEAIQRSVREQ